MSQYDFDEAKTIVAAGGKAGSTHDMHWKAQQDTVAGAAAAQKEKDQRKN